MERHPVRETHHGVGWMEFFERLGALWKTLTPGLDQMRLPLFPVFRHSLMRDDGGRRREKRGAADVIAVVLCDDDVANRLLGDGLNILEDIARLGLIVTGVD